MSNPMNAPVKRWHNGVLVEEVDHKEASGHPPEAEQALSDEWTPMPIPDHYSGIIDGFNNGIHQRRTAEGVLEVKAWAYCVTDTEQLLESPVYTLVPEADYRPFGDYLDTSRPTAVREMTAEGAVERAERRTYARAQMGPNDRSAMDMIQVCRELQSDARQRERAWQQEQDKRAEQERLDLEAIELARKVEYGLQLIKAKKEKH